MIKEIIIPKGLLIVLVIGILVLTLQNLKLLPSVFAIITTVLMFLTFSQKFNTRANKFLTAKLALLVPATFVVTQLLGAKWTTFILIYYSLIWLFIAFLLYLNARTTKR